MFAVSEGVIGDDDVPCFREVGSDMKRECTKHARLHIE